MLRKTLKKRRRLTKKRKSLKGGNIHKHSYLITPSSFFYRLERQKNPDFNYDLSTNQDEFERIQNLLEKYKYSYFNLSYEDKKTLRLNKLFNKTDEELANVLEGLYAPLNQDERFKKKFYLTVTDEPNINP